MNININSWHYKWYKWTYSFYDSDIPEQTNLCQYVNRMVWMSLLIGMISVLFSTFTVIGPMCYYLFAPLLLIIGYRPQRTSKQNLLKGPTTYIKYSGLNVFGWFRLYPWHLVLPVFVVWFEFHIWRHNAVVNVVIGHVMIVVIWFILLWSTGVLSNSETIKLIRATIKAKTSHVCPIVTFSKDPTSDE